MFYAGAWGLAVRLWGGQEAAGEALRGVLDEWLFCDLSRAEPDRIFELEDLKALDSRLPESERRLGGVYFTSEDVAQMMGSLLAENCVEHVCDPACGTGELLIAASTIEGVNRVTGIEIDPRLAVAAAIRLRWHAPDLDVRIHCEDALGTSIDGVGAVIMNPPYLGEKGRKTEFDALRRKHPALSDRFTARMDLSYLFIHLALDMSDSLVMLTSEYWLTADSASALRGRLARRGEGHFFSLGAGVFPDAPGHHSLISVFGLEPVDLDEHPCVRERGSLALPGEAPAFPFASASLDSFEAFPSLGDFLRDQQGFVSGLDRATRRHPELPHGRACFLADSSEVPVEHHWGGGIWRPVVRASDCEADRIFVKPPGTTFVYWLDGPVDEPGCVERLEWARERLERRREARSGSMPWYRLHWPRDRADQIAPKLVVPRRAGEPRFCLDLSASHVSSDCTYLVAPEDECDPVGLLIRVMVSLNAEGTRSYLEDFAKRKGKMIEFYSSPLQQVPVFFAPGTRHLVDEELEARAIALESRLSASTTAEIPSP